MGVKLQLVLGLILFTSVWIATGTSEEIQNPNSQEHRVDDRNANTIEKQKTETEIKYHYKNTPSNGKTSVETKGEHLESSSETHDDSHEKQNELGKDAGSEIGNVIRKETVPKRREENARSIDIEKYISPEFQNNEFTLPVSSDTEKYLDEPFSFKISTRKGPDFDHTTSKTSMFSKFTYPIQKLEQDYEDHLKASEDDHHRELVNDHIEMENDHDDEHDHDLEDHDIDDMTVDKMIERSESTPTNISLGWEMKISKDDDPEKNFKGFTVVKYRKVEHVSQFNDTKVFPFDSKRGPHSVNTTTMKPSTSTTRKNNLLTKPPTEKNNSHLLSNKIETETIKAINSVTTEQPSTKQVKSDEDLLPKEQIVEENQLNSVQAVTPIIILSNNHTDRVVMETTTVEFSEWSTKAVKNETSMQSFRTNGTSAKPSEATSTVGYENSTVQHTNELTTELHIATTESPIKVPESHVTTTEPQITTTEPSIKLTEPQYTTTERHITTIESHSTTTESPLFTTEQILYPSTTYYDQDVFLGTDITTNNDEETTTMSENVTTMVQSFENNATSHIGEIYNESVTATVSIKDFKKPEDTETRNIGAHTMPESTSEDATTYTKVFTLPTTYPPQNITTPVETTENIPVTNLINVMSDATTILPETSSQKSSTQEVIDLTTVSEKKDLTTMTTEKIFNTTEVAFTTELNFVHVESVGTNQTTFIPETLSPNFNYPVVLNPKEREAKITNVLSVGTTTEDPDDLTNTSSATENITVDNGGDKKGKIAAIVISTVGAICLVILAVLLYILKKRQKKFNYKQRCRPVDLDNYRVDNLSAYNSFRRKGADRQSKRSYGNPAFEDPTVPSHPLNFPALAKFATNSEDMKAEFEEIPQISARTSELPDGCETKNRYANVIPLPETRVYLKPIEGCPNSDYINANYVTGPKNTRGYYIACQAPMHNTVDDFWRMIWEQQCRVILMITHLFENGVEKCADYLPPSDVLDCHRLFGDFQVTMKKREAKEKYIISSIQFKNMVSNSWREVTHFWYLGWPEKGIPREANSLIAFLIEARSYMKAATLDMTTSTGIRNDPSQNEFNPVVVHCSPGTGRTGVVIACDIAIRDYEKTRLVDIPKIVYRIRRDRANAIQTKEQYMFIYKVISLYATKLTGGALDSF